MKTIVVWALKFGEAVATHSQEVNSEDAAETLCAKLRKQNGILWALHSPKGL